MTTGALLTDNTHLGTMEAVLGQTIGTVTCNLAHFHVIYISVSLRILQKISNVYW